MTPAEQAARKATIEELARSSRMESVNRPPVINTSPLAPPRYANRSAITSGGSSIPTPAEQIANRAPVDKWKAPGFAKGPLGPRVGAALRATKNIGGPLLVADADAYNQRMLEDNVSKGDLGVGTMLRSSASLASRAPQVIAGAIAGRPDALGPLYGPESKVRTEPLPVPPKSIPVTQVANDTGGEFNDATAVETTDRINKPLVRRYQPEIKGNGFDGIKFGNNYLTVRNDGSGQSAIMSDGFRFTPGGNAESGLTSNMDARMARVQKAIDDGRIIIGDPERVAARDAKFAREAAIVNAREEESRQRDRIREEQAIRQQLMTDLRGPTGDMSPTEFGEAKRRRTAARDMLNRMDARDQSQAQMQIESAIANRTFGQKERELESRDEYRRRKLGVDEDRLVQDQQEKQLAAERQANLDTEAYWKAAQEQYHKWYDNPELEALAMQALVEGAVPLAKAGVKNSGPRIMDLAKHKHLFDAYIAKRKPGWFETAPNIADVYSSVPAMTDLPR